MALDSKEIDSERRKLELLEDVYHLFTRSLDKSSVFKPITNDHLHNRHELGVKNSNIALEWGRKIQKAKKLVNEILGIELPCSAQTEPTKIDGKYVIAFERDADGNIISFAERLRQAIEKQKSIVFEDEPPVLMQDASNQENMADDHPEPYTVISSATPAAKAAGEGLEPLVYRKLRT